MYVQSEIEDYEDRGRFEYVLTCFNHVYHSWRCGKLYQHLIIDNFFDIQNHFHVPLKCQEGDSDEGRQSCVTHSLIDIKHVFSVVLFRCLIIFTDSSLSWRCFQFAGADVQGEI